MFGVFFYRMVLSGWLSLVLQMAFAAVLVWHAPRSRAQPGPRGGTGWTSPREVLALNSESVSEVLRQIMLKTESWRKPLVLEAVRELGSASGFKTKRNTNIFLDFFSLWVHIFTHADLVSCFDETCASIPADAEIQFHV